MPCETLVPPRLIRTFSSPSVISSSAIPDCWTRSIKVFSLRRSIALVPLVGQRVRHGELVPFGAQAADDAHGQIAEVRALAVWLASVDVRNVNFHERNAHGSQRIADRHARMGVCGRIDDDEINPGCTCVLDAIDELRFRVTLEGFNCRSGGARLGGKSLLYRL